MWHHCMQEKQQILQQENSAFSVNIAHTEEITVSTDWKSGEVYLQQDLHD